MPKIFTAEKKTRLESRLIEAGIELFGQHGFRKTSIDEIVSLVGIAKGSFYSFFPAKEHLLVSCLMKIRECIETDITMPILQTCQDAETATAELLGSGRNILQKYPIVSEYYNPPTRRLLENSCSSAGLEFRDIAPLPNFRTVQEYLRLRGLVVDIDPGVLAECTEVLLVYCISSGKDMNVAGYEKLLEIITIGCAGFVSDLGEIL